MGKLNIFQISFSSYSAAYFAGDPVEGHVTIELLDQMSMRGIRLVFDGEAYVSWEEGSGDNKSSYSAREKYFHQEVLLHGKWPQEEDVARYSLPAGRHTFPFRFFLPYSLPGSFEGSVAPNSPYVRYTVEATIDKPWKFDHTCNRHFTVISTLDLNTDEKALLPAQGEDNKTLCCLCCASEPITADFRIDHGGYVPGEPINLFSNIRNSSDRIMNKSFVALKMEITMYTTGRKNKNKSTKEMDRVEQGPIDEGRSFSWEGQQFVVPPLPPSYLTGCNIIDIKYILELNVEPSGPAFNLTVPLEIVIGTIPLQQVLMQYPPPYPSTHPSAHADYVMPAGTIYPITTATVLNTQGDNPTSTVQPTVPFMPPSSVSFMPPPSCYCRVSRINHKPEEDERNKNVQTGFAPAYVYYNWGHSSIPVN